MLGPDAQIPAKDKNKNIGGMLFDVSFILIILTLTIWSLTDYRRMLIGTPLVFLLVGSAFLFAKIYKNASYVEKGFFWISDNVPSRIIDSNHILIGFLMITIGLASCVIPETRNGKSIELLWRETRESIWFWISVIVILILAVIVAFYNYKKERV